MADNPTYQPQPAPAAAVADMAQLVRYLSEELDRIRVTLDSVDERLRAGGL